MREKPKHDSVWEMACHTDPGLIREQNEDVVEVHPEAGVVILADGMGGYNAGEVASAMAVSAIGSAVLKHLETCGFDDEAALEDMLRAAVSQAHQSILDEGTATPERAGMGTTVVMGIFAGKVATLAHVGDSRAYLWSDGRLRQITRDHSLLQEQIDAGVISPEAARTSSHKNLVTRALGVDHVVLEPEIRRYDVHPGDCFMFCSDGLSDMVDDDEIADIFLRGDFKAPDCLPRLAEALVESAKEHGGRDNVSVALVRARPGRGSPRTLLKRILGR